MLVATYLLIFSYSPYPKLFWLCCGILTGWFFAFACYHVAKIQATMNAFPRAGCSFHIRNELNKPHLLTILNYLLNMLETFHYHHYWIQSNSVITNSLGRTIFVFFITWLISVLKWPIWLQKPSVMTECSLTTEFVIIKFHCTVQNFLNLLCLISTKY
jgi:hypothetical protein